MADKVLQNVESFQNLLSKVDCHIFVDRPFMFVLRERNGDYSLQIQFYAPDNDGGAGVEKQFCRIWPLQDTMTDSEVIRTAWHAAKAAVMHELEEKFLVEGESIFNPHTDYRAMVQMRQRKNIDDVRIPNGTDTDGLHSRTPKIQYHHFVSFSDGLYKADQVDWIQDTLHILKGDYIIDGGHWRDGVIHTRRGVEFEFKEDALLFTENFGGEYEFRP